MGDPKLSRRKYDTPSHPWQGSRIKEENELLKKYGLKNKRELWKAQSLLRNYRRQGRNLLARLRFGDVQAEKEMKGLVTKLANLGVLPEDATLDDVLALDLEKILERRLQTLVYLKGLAYTPKQARQLIIHGHTVINDRKVTVPGYLVKKNEEPSIAYNPYSPLASDLHPSRPTPEHVERAIREFSKPEGEEKLEKEEEVKEKETKAATSEEKEEKADTKEEGKDKKTTKSESDTVNKNEESGEEKEGKESESGGGS
ncbi:MAG: 30S ribosomal protein S4 [Thermoplasmata archaeon]|nr:MAG: 30S ribosomal protein S4 [Thermoplasmata archaeon]